MSFVSIVSVLPGTGTSATSPSITTPASNPFVLVHVALAHASAVVSSLTITGFGGTATQIASTRTGTAFLSVWAIVGVTPSRAGTVRANFSVSAPFNMAVETWSGVDLSGPCPPADAKTNNATGTVTLTPSNLKTGDFCVGSVANSLSQDVRPVTPTNRYIQNVTAINLAVGDGASSVTLGGTNNLATAKVAVRVKAAAPPPPPPPANSTPVNVTVTNAAGSAMLTAYAITEPIQPPGGGGGLPAGVTLQAIDGETMTSSTTMSLDYFVRQKAGSHDSFTYATNTATNGTSWDDATFFPLALFYGLQDVTAGDCTAVAALNINISDATFGGASDDDANVAGPKIWIINSATSGTPGEPTWQDALCCGLLEDEVSPTARIAAMTAAKSNNRFWKAGFQHFELTSNSDGYTGLTMSQMLNTLWPTATGGVTRYVDIVMSDVYWFATSATDNWHIHGGDIYGANGRSAGDLTTDQMARGSNYGNQIDIMRAWAPARTTLPVWIYIETGDGLAGDPGARDITANEFNWATWASIIHGASGISYFYRHDQFATGVQTQCTNTNALIKLLARIIRSPFAIGYFSVSPLGYQFPVMAISDTMFNTGIDAMAKWYSGSNFSNTIGGGPTTFTAGFYIFATTRASEATTNISATFTLADTSATVATVVGESRTVAISGGVFTDNFANAWTVHIYKIS